MARKFETPWKFLKNSVNTSLILDLRQQDKIINLSISHGVVPKEMKIRRVVPIFKSGDQTLFTTYRPISVLPCFSKLLERTIYNQILLYLNNFNIFHDNQYGFRGTTQLPLL